MDKAALSRHDMVFMTPDALAYAKRNAQPSELAGHLSVDIPAVVARQQRPRNDGSIEVGFPLPETQDGNRLRVASRIPKQGIQRVVTPFHAASHDISAVGQTASAVVAALLSNGQLLGLQVGIYGSLAMQLVTNMPYFSPTSDYDIFIRPVRPDAGIRDFYHRLGRLEQRFQIKIDVEIACLEDSGAKLAEVFSGQKTVLCKGLYGVQLCPIGQLGLHLD